ncbi:MAG TPA: outer membrane beta-barrel protein [Gallionellaceae bacterium]|nr:outer membrane beta-barrel protein [Gallionellaceae bacterium]
MPSNRIAVLVFLSFLTAAPLSYGKDVSQWNSSLIVSVGQSTSDKACKSPWVDGTPGLTCTENDRAYRLAYVYHFNSNLGLEISTGSFGHAKAEGTLNTAPSPMVAPAAYTWDLHATGVAIAGVGTLHLGESLELFGKAGIVRAIVREETHFVDATGTPYFGISLNGTPITSENLYKITVGAGIQYNFNRNFAIRAQYENFGSYDIYSAYNVGVDDKVTISLLSAGLVLNF